MPRTLSSEFTVALLTWYRKNRRDLPWRRTKDPYRIWISEVMLQQTTVKAVLGYYGKWCRRFPTIRGLSRAGEEEVLKAWQGLGYYNRARNLHKAARVLVNDFQGKLPSSPETLKALPGFGPYTVGAVLSIAYGIPIAIVDANIRRVFMRILAIRGRSEVTVDKKLLPQINELLPMDYAGDFNQSLMELGALICRPKEPVCNLCPVSRFCLAYASGIQEVIPESKSVSLKQIKAVVAVIHNKSGKILIQKRPRTGLLAGLWEFPGGKVRPGEGLEKALKREIHEELEASVTVGRKVIRTSHYYTQFKVDLTAYECIIIAGEPKSPLSLRWVRAEDLGRYPMPSGSAKIAESLSIFSSH